MSRKIYLFRHGETQWNVAGKMQGRLDSPLTERGREQALAHGRLWRHQRCQPQKAQPIQEMQVL